MPIDSQVERGIELLQNRLGSVMKERGFRFENELARYLGIPRTTLQEYLKPVGSESGNRLPTPETLAKIRLKVSAISDEDAEIIGRAFSAAMSKSRISGGATRFGGKAKKLQAADRTQDEKGQPDLAHLSGDNDAEIGRLVREILTKVMAGKTVAPIVGSVDLFTQLGDRYEVGDMPNVLTKENFEKLNISGWTESDKHHFLGYLNFVLEEARKGMMLLAQFKPEDIRDQLLVRVGRNADLLWRTFKIVSSVAPIEYVKDIQLEQLCQGISSPNPSKGESQ